MSRATAAPKEGDSRVIVDLLTQTAYAYRGDVLVGASSISSAKRGKVTPLGFWSVLQKKKFHRSRKYDNAPMPFMQRLDEYGIAMHGGANPGYPASHGCIRMPMKFAEKLYAFTALGTCTALAAVLNSIRFSEVQGNAGVGLEIRVLAAVVVGGTLITGGRGTLAGTLVGVVLLGVLGTALTFLGINPFWEKAAQGAIILLASGADALAGLAARRPVPAA